MRLRRPTLSVVLLLTAWGSVFLMELSLWFALVAGIFMLLALWRMDVEYKRVRARMIYNEAVVRLIDREDPLT